MWHVLWKLKGWLGFETRGDTTNVSSVASVPRDMLEEAERREREWPEEARGWSIRPWLRRIAVDASCCDARPEPCG